MPTRLFLLLLLLASGLPAHAEPVVVMAARQASERLSREEVTNIFLGRYRALATGLPAQPIDQPPASPLRGAFYQLLVNKDAASINAYWSRLHFSGKATPPLQASEESEVIQQLLNVPGAIAYVDRKQVDERMRIVFEFQPRATRESRAEP